MLKYLNNIKDVSRIEQGLVPPLHQFQKLSFESSLGDGKEGAFGTVYSVIGTDDEPRTQTDLVVKIIPIEGSDRADADHAHEVIKLLHLKANRHHQATGETLFATIPGLSGLPFVTFKAYDPIEEINCVAMVMVDLGALGYKDCGRDDNIIKLNAHINPIKRLHLATQLSQAVKWLHAQSFVHSDLGVSSVFVNENSCRLALIDFDSGYHFEEQAGPLTEGKIGFGLPYLWDRLLNSLGIERELRVIDRLQKEYFMLATSVFEIIFGLTQYFYLHPGAENKERYLAEQPWPSANFDNSAVNSSAEALYQQFMQRYEAYTNAGLGGILESFATVFGPGYTNGYKRYSPNQWVRMLYNVLSAQDLDPLIISFQASQEEVRSKTEEIALSWQTNGAYAVYLNDELQVGQSMEKRIVPGGDKVYILRVVNEFGEHTERIEITALREEPIFMDLSISETLRTNLEPLVMRWECAHTVRLEIVGIDSQLPSFGTLDVEPTKATTYQLIAHGYFDQQVARTIEVDVVRPTIDAFYAEVNLEHGLDNVDLHFATRYTNQVTITPKPGAMETIDGVVHVKLHTNTEFTLTAHGDFVSITETVIARPFPVPAIVQLRMPQPELDINLTLRPDALPPLKLKKLEQSIGMADLQIDFVPLNTVALSRSLEAPPFVQLPQISSPKHLVGEEFGNLFHHIKSKVNTPTHEKNTNRPV